MHSNRRDFLRTLMAGAVGLSVTWRADGQAAPPITATKLSPTVVLLTGNGGNVALIIGSDALMLVDGGLPDRAAEMMKAVAAVESPPITTVFNTHWHYDHVGTNELLGKTGATIVAHENTRKHLGTRTTLEAFNQTFEPLQPHGLPSKTFSTRGTLAFGKESLEYVPVPPAHTDGDAYVFLPGPNVLHTGDLLFKDMYPFIDYSTGGWVGGMAAACDTIYKACNAETQVIPGHGPMATRDDLRASHEMLATVQDRLAALAKKGVGVDEVVKAAPLKDLDARWGNGFMNPENFVRVAYTSLLRRDR